MNPDGTVRSHSSHIATQIQVDRYTLAGAGTEHWAPCFGYRGFRFVETHGFPGTPSLDSLTGEVMHSNVVSTARFDSSNELLNRINAAARRTLLNNTHGFLTDTPTFEKNGWTGDAHASALAAALNFDMTGVWTKWMADFRDAQADSGEIPAIVPSTPYYGYEDTPGWSIVNGPIPSWDAAALVLPNDLYHVTGNIELLQVMYPTQKRLVDYTGRWFTEDFLYANPSNSFLGEYGLYMPSDVDPIAAAERRIADGNGPGPGGLDSVATAYYFHMTDLLARNAALLGREGDAQRYAALAEAIRDAFNARYWDDAGSRYRTPAKLGERQPFLQYQNILPVAFGIVPDGRAADVVAHVADDLAANDLHLTSTGVFSGRYLMTLLTDYGCVDAAFQIATRTDAPSWGWWLVNGVNTMLEGWGLDSRSHDHHYWASVSSWLYQGLAGIRPAAPGYDKIVIRPAHPRGLDRVSAALDTVRGTISSSWRRCEDAVMLHVDVPADATAEVWCSKRGLGTIVPAEGSVKLRDEPDHVVFAVGAGEHRFQCAAS